MSVQVQCLSSALMKPATSPGKPLSLQVVRGLGCENWSTFFIKQFDSFVFSTLFCMSW